MPKSRDTKTHRDGGPLPVTDGMVTFVVSDESLALALDHIIESEAPFFRPSGTLAHPSVASQSRSKATVEAILEATTRILDEEDSEDEEDEPDEEEAAEPAAKAEPSSIDDLYEDQTRTDQKQHLDVTISARVEAVDEALTRMVADTMSVG